MLTASRRKVDKEEENNMEVVTYKRERERERKSSNLLIQ